MLAIFRPAFFLALTTALMLGAGCRVLESRDVEPNWRAEVLDDLADTLGEVHWQPRIAWSPTRQWETRDIDQPASESLRFWYASNRWRESLVKCEERLNLQAGASPIVLDEETLLAELAQRDDVAGWNAAILLAQQNPQRAKPLEPLLARLVTKPPHYARPDAPPDSRFPKISGAMQAAAAEAWCLVLLTERADPIDALAPAGKALLIYELPDEVRGELFRSLGRVVPPANVPGLDAALPEKRGARFNQPLLRQAAMEACVLYALWNREALTASDKNETEDPWPAPLKTWQWEPDAYFESDPVLRRRFAYWLVLTQHPNAAKMLQSHLTDEDFTVRDDALKNLGWLKTPEALDILRTQASRPEPRVRAMAVKGLGHWGATLLLRFLEDPSHEVRLSVAEELGRFPTREAALALQKLQADASRDVERAAMEATRSWPDQLAIPVLLQGMEHASVQTRRECFRELRRRTELEDTFPITAGPEIRRAAIQSLARAWSLPVQLDLSPAEATATAKVNRLRVEELQQYLLDVMNPEFAENSARHQAAIKALQESSPEDIPAVETFLLEQPASQRGEVIRREVLAVLSPVHAALLHLESTDVQDRRRAASELRTFAQGQSLSPLAVRGLGQALQREADPLVWRFAMAALLPDDNPETARIASWAANHRDGGIRQLASEFAFRHKRPEFADWLLPLLHDPQKTVQLAAIGAAGECGNRIVIEGLPGSDAASALPGLKPLLAHADPRVSLAAAIAMSRLGDPLGHDELLRLSQHPDDRVRLEVIAAMGTSGQTRFVETLIGTGWTAQTEPIQRAVLTSLDQLVPTEKHPPALATATRTEDKIKTWAEWWNPSQFR